MHVLKYDTVLRLDRDVLQAFQKGIRRIPGFDFSKGTIAYGMIKNHVFPYTNVMVSIDYFTQLNFSKISTRTMVFATKLIGNTIASYESIEKLTQWMLLILHKFNPDHFLFSEETLYTWIDIFAQQ